MADYELTEGGERLTLQKQQLDWLKERIDSELRIARPDRYEPGDAFLDAVAERISDEVPATLARELLARDLVGQREGQATRRVNRFLKDLAGTNGQYAMPLGWHLFADEPVSITIPITDDAGEPCGYRRERVTLRAVKAEDWLNFVSAGRADAQHRFDAEMRMYDAAEWCAQQQGADPFYDWASKVAPPISEATA